MFIIYYFVVLAIWFASVIDVLTLSVLGCRGKLDAWGAYVYIMEIDYLCGEK